MMMSRLRAQLALRAERLSIAWRDLTPVFVALFCAVIVFVHWLAATHSIVDPDVWWVAAAGRDFLAHGRIPRENYYSFIEPHHPWVMHEWLPALPYYAGLRALGPGFFALVTVVSSALLVALILYMTLGRTRRFAVGFWLAALALSCFTFVTPRVTQLAVLFPLLLCALAFRPRFGKGALAGVVLVEWLWANTHGSFPLGVALLVVAVLDEPADRSRRVAAVALAAAATLVNPYGLRLHGLVWGYFSAQSPTFERINHWIREFAPLWRHPEPTELFGLAVVLVLTLVAAARGRRLARAGLALALIAMAVMHERHAALAGTLICVLLPRAFDEERPTPRTRAVALMVAPAFLFGLIAFGVTAHRRAPLDWIGEPELVRLGARLPPDARAFVTFSGSSLVLYHQAERGVRIYTDPRNDCYSAPALDAGFALSAERLGRARIDELLSRYHSEYALVPAGEPIADELAQDQRWPLLAADGGWRLFQRREDLRARVVRR
jgi:hypothetical protein